MKRDPRTGQWASTPVRQRLISRSVIDDCDCWVWQGWVKKDGGYGLVKDAERHTRVAHRLAYEVFVGPIPEGLQLDHLCRNRACINPDHLEPVTAQENCHRSTAPSAVNATKTNCPSDHPYDESNTYLDKRGRRHCKECSRQRVRDRRARARDPLASLIAT